MDGGVGADDLDGEVLPCDTQLALRNSRVVLTLLQSLNLVLETPLMVINSAFPLSRGSTAAVVAFSAHGGWVGDRWSVVGRFDGQ